MYAFEVLKSDELEGLFAVSRKVWKPTADHWLTGGEIWTLCGLDRYGTSVPESKLVRSPQYVAPTAGSISVSLV